MDLREVVQITPEDAGVLVPWDEADGCYFKLAYAGRKILAAARAKAIKRAWDNQQKQVIEKLDDAIFDKELMEHTVLGWEGLRGKHLCQILDPSCTEIKITEEQMEIEIPCTKENKDMILLNYNLTFSRFVSTICLQIETYRQYKEQQLRKNS